MRTSRGARSSQGMAVDIAYDGDEAAMKINVNPYDVVVLDRDLPGIHGDQLCQMITASHHPAMILMLTAAGAADDRVAGLALGADDYLAKPFHFPELVLRIRALARRKRTTRRGTLQAAGIDLDPCSRELSAATVEQSISPPRNGPSSKRCSRPAPPDSPRRSCSSRRGTKTPIRSPTPSRSRSPGSDANLASPKLSRRLPAPGTGSLAQPLARGVSGPRASHRCPSPAIRTGSQPLFVSRAAAASPAGRLIRWLASSTAWPELTVRTIAVAGLDGSQPRCSSTDMTFPSCAGRSQDSCHRRVRRVSRREHSRDGRGLGGAAP